jgi:hypothetical protein
MAVYDERFPTAWLPVPTASCASNDLSFELRR